MNKTTCSIAGCERKHAARGLCGMHYGQARAAKQGTCTVDECTNKSHSRGYCQAHYRRWNQTGDTQAHRPLRGHLPEGMIWCARCEEVLPAERFQQAAGRPNGVTAYCLDCIHTLRATKYRATLRAQQARWRKANPEKTAGYYQRYAENNPEKRAATRRRVMAAKPDLYAAIARAADSNRRAREKNAPGRASAEAIQARWDYYGGKCWMCGCRAVEVDHVKPLAKGGSHWPSNLRPACRTCNSSKRAKWPFPTEVFTHGREATPREVTPRAA